MSENILKLYKRVTRLTIQDRKRAHNATISSIRAKTLIEPKEKNFRPNTGDLISIAQSLLPYIILAVIGLIALYISGGKQLEAAYEVFKPIVTGAKSNFMPEDYAENSAKAILAFGEVSSIFFMVMASFLPAGYITIKERKVNYVAIMFYGFSIVCASIAITANLSVKPVAPNPDYSFLEGILKIVPPLTALFIGFTFERLIIAWREKTKVWKVAFEQAHANWFDWSQHPEHHPDYEITLQNNLFQILYGYEGNYELIESNKKLKELVYSVEIEAMSEKLERVNVAEMLANPNPIYSQN